MVAAAAEGSAGRKKKKKKKGENYIFYMALFSSTLGKGLVTRLDEEGGSGWRGVKKIKRRRDFCQPTSGRGGEGYRRRKMESVNSTERRTGDLRGSAKRSDGRTGALKEDLQSGVERCTCACVGWVGRRERGKDTRRRDGYWD